MTLTGKQPTGAVRLSVVIPAYNVAHLVGETLLSLQKQSLQADEVIVVDDGSTDNTSTILANEFPWVHVIRQVNGGLVSARRTGVSAARGEFIALMDSDDICHPDRFACQIDLLQRYPEMQLCASDFSAFDSSGVVSESFASSYYSAISNAGGVANLFPERQSIKLPGHRTNTEVCFGHVYNKLALANFLHPPTVMFRRKALEAAGNFDTNAGSMCDWEWLVRMARNGTIGYISLPLLAYRISDTQMSAPRYRYGRAQAIMKVIQIICDRDPELYKQHRSHFNALFGEYCLEAADSGADSNRRASWKWLLKSVFKYRTTEKQSLLVLLKLLLPHGLLNKLRSIRSRYHSGKSQQAPAREITSGKHLP